MRVLRLLAPALLLATAAVLVGWVVGHARRRHPPPPPAVDIRMTAPRFYGRDDRGRPFTVTGDQAVRDAHDPHLVVIEHPDLQLENAQGAPTTARADHGRYRDDTNLLTLSGSVVVRTGAGDVFQSDEAQVQTVTGDVHGRRHARADGPSGHIEGDAYSLSDKGDHATFTGAVRSHVVHAAQPASPAAPALRGATSAR